MPINRSDRNSRRPAPEVIEFYTQFAEESRLGAGSARLEYERTQELLERLLPPPPGRIVDVGGGGGAYAFWLADRGYQIDLVDATPRLVEGHVGETWLLRPGWLPFPKMTHAGYCTLTALRMLCS